MTQENINSYEPSDRLITTAPASQLYGSETILLAEDDNNILKLVETILTTFGYDVITAVDGQDCINKFIEHKAKIHLILMDMMMPKKNGQQAYEEIKQLKPEVKVLFSSGYSDISLRDKLATDDATDLILKPAPPEELLKKIRSMLDNQKTGENIRIIQK